MYRNEQLQNWFHLSNANGVSGFEHEVVSVLEQQLRGLGTIKRDNLCNLYLYRKENMGDRPVVMLDAHTDEVGFMVQEIGENGLLKFVTLGGWVPANVAAQPVRVINRRGEAVRGVVASKPPHFLSEAERKAPPATDQMRIDIGAESREQVEEELGIGIGAPIVPDVDCRYDEKLGLLFGKAFDCRLGCAALVDTLRALEGVELPVDIVAAFAAQEEVGCRGATVTTRVVQPKCAIVFEGTPADDSFAGGAGAQTALKKGPMLRHYDAGMISHPGFMRFALDTAKAANIPAQEAVRSGGGTNAGAIHVGHHGVPSIVLGLPVRYIHAHTGIAAACDMESTVALACEILKNLQTDKLFV
ncbi:MAG: M20/M25/M40 family metallo-hydrolase [Clostridiales bacterium]|nr:M20/M25/M40 family metallo-hydrolase [Clostridiales bacterium]